MRTESFDGRLLVIANDCFSEMSSNGRTLMNLLRWLPKEQLAQFYLHGMPDQQVCSHYFQVSDHDALNAFLHKKVKPNTEITKTESAAGSEKKIKKNCRNFVLRNMVWQSFRWWSRELEAFLEDFNPTVVLLQAGDSPFMYAIARKIASLRKIPLMMYNSENYVLKKKMYNGVPKGSLWHKLLQIGLRRAYRKFMEQASYCIYSTEYLETCYQGKYPHAGRSAALYTISEMTPLPEMKEDERFCLLYCGNLGVGRVEPLNEIAQVLKRVDPTAVLEIYGKFVSQEDQDLLCTHTNVYYGGFVSYGEIPILMGKASMLLHCENNARIVNLQTAFSTKIADSLASGRPFLVYASREYPFVQYLEQYQCAHIAVGKKELAEVLTLCIRDGSYRNQYTENAVSVAKQNHSILENTDKMKDILIKVAGEKDPGENR